MSDIQPGSDKPMTQLLQAWQAGDNAAFEQILEMAYAQLRRIAANQLSKEFGGHTLTPTDLVHEAFFNLVDTDRMEFKTRAQFFGTAAVIMRRILLNYARNQKAQKRGGADSPITLAEEGVLDGRRLDIEALDDALQAFEAIDPKGAKMVSLKFFVGLKAEEIAKVLDVAPITVHREWKAARAWLNNYLSKKT